MEINNSQKEVAQKMDKRALIVYGFCSVIVYSLALGYCYYTDHLLEAGIVGVVMLILGILVINVFKSTK